MRREHNNVVFAVGRLNPPTRGHSVMVQKLKETAQLLNALPVLFIVDGEKSGKDKRKNPLSADQRLSLARKLYSDIKIDIVSSAFEALEVLYVQGLHPCAWVAGSDRASNYRRLLESEGLTGEIVEIDRDAGDADGVSATAARQAALEGNLEEFSHHMPSDLNRRDLEDLARSIREVISGFDKGFEINRSSK